MPCLFARSAHFPLAHTIACFGILIYPCSVMDIKQASIYSLVGMIISVSSVLLCCLHEHTTVNVSISLGDVQFASRNVAAQRLEASEMSILSE